MSESLLDPTQNDLKDLKRRALAVSKRRPWLKSGPICIEFAGSPKSGKSGTIETVTHFFRRTNVPLAAPAEGASRRTPAQLKKDFVAFNVWSLNYAVSEVLMATTSPQRPAVVFLDRGPFDAIAWMRFVRDEKRLLTSSQCRAIEDYALHPKWTSRIHRLYIFTVSPAESLRREHRHALIAEGGIAMNKPVLTALVAQYQKLARDFRRKYPVRTLDTTSDTTPLGVAFAVATDILDLLEQRPT